MTPEWSARKARVMDAMRASVAKSTRHPLADPQLRLDAREFLVVVGTKDGNGTDVVLMDAPETSCTKKCAEFRDQFVSSLAAAATGRCPGLPRAAPRAAFLVREASVGCADDRCDLYPTLTFARAPWKWNATRGVMSPNPYFGAFDAWRGRSDAMAAAAAARPLEARVPRAFWRGGVSLPKESCRDAAPAREGKRESLRERLAAVDLTLRRPDLFDVGPGYANLTERKRRRIAASVVSWLECEARGRGETPWRASPAGAARLGDAGFVHFTEYSRYQALLSLPGGSNCSFSRNLNHIWAARAPVLLWRRNGAGAPPLYDEWYYAGLDDGATHLDVGGGTAAAAVAALLGPGGRGDRARLAAAAAAVHDTFLCPCCVAEFYARLLEAIAARQRGADLDALADARTWQKREVHAVT